MQLPKHKSKDISQYTEQIILNLYRTDSKYRRPTYKLEEWLNNKT